jgi:flavin-dependent dehydrogenase
MRVDLPLNGSIALSRSSLDSSLVEAAVAKGAHFCGSARAKLGRLEKDRRILEVFTESEQLEVSARIVIAADGLGSQVMAQAGVPGRTRASAKRAVIGLGGVFQASVLDYESGIIHMAVGAEGYVGLVRVEDGSLNVAAALNPLALRDAGSSATLVDHLLHECGWPNLAGPPAKGWKGTPELTRRPQRPGAERLFAVGDAAGYLEPFTGEGVFWALAGARMLAPFAARVTNHWEPGLLDDWSRAHSRLMDRAQRICQITSFVLARPFLTRALIRALMSNPQLARPMIRRVGAPIPSLG